MQDPTKLKVWQRAHALSLEVMRVFTRAACREVPDLRRQAIRAANSIVDNLAEGCGKRSPRELARYADMACGSAVELRAQIIRARDMGVISRQKADELEEELEIIRRMLVALAAAVRRQDPLSDDEPRPRRDAVPPERRDSQY